MTVNIILLMKNYIIIALVVIFIGGVVFFTKNNDNKNMPIPKVENNSVSIYPISHATAVISWGDTVIYTDPVGGAEAFSGQPSPNIILVTDVHGDHLSTSTLDAIIGNAVLIVPQAVKDLLPENLAVRAVVLANDEAVTEQGLRILAMPMYNLPEKKDAYHIKGRGNGYILEREGKRVYVAGDTAGIPEMRALKNIDIALIPMNLPYTMDIAQAADAVLAFAPKHVYPYHYRGPDGLSDVSKFKELVNSSNPDIDVVLLDWYKN